jgi:hypothetical protein
MGHRVGLSSTDGGGHFIKRTITQHESYGLTKSLFARVADFRRIKQRVKSRR